MLLDLLETNGLGLPPDASTLPDLTPFAVAYRYDEPPEPHPAEVTVERRWLRECVGRTRVWAESMLLKIAPPISDDEGRAP